jgi:hypothetical protein
MEIFLSRPAKLFAPRIINRALLFFGSAPALGRRHWRPRRMASVIRPIQAIRAARKQDAPGFSSFASFVFELSSLAIITSACLPTVKHL